MRCLWCRRKIGPFRRLWDSEYCSALHRKLAKAASARELRDAGYLPGEVDEFLVLPNEAKRGKTAAKTSFAGFAMLFGLAVLALLSLPGSESGGAPFWRPPASYVPARSDSIWERIHLSLPSLGKTSVALSENFQGGLKHWNIGAAPPSGSSWVVRSGSVQPRELRLWEPSLKLRDYDFAFQAQIEQRAVGWAFRARDVNNYYAAKIVVSRPAPFPVSEIVRYAVIDGRESTRVQLPIPVRIQQGSIYRVQMRVKGENFVTSVNGEVVDRWSDSRLKAGGIGFFAEPGEVAAIMGVRVSEERGLLDRIFLPALFEPPLVVVR